MFTEEFVPITPVNFFQLTTECRHVPTGKLSGRNFRKYLLPDTSGLCDNEHFADVAMGWNQQGMEFFVQVNKQFEDCCYPEVDYGDSVEIMIDTRDVKTTGFNTRFCHHFFFLPEPINDHQTGEITHFRTEDTHELCDPKDLQLKVQFKRDGYTMQIGIPRKCLNGYDPEQFDRLGFTYRINRPRWQSQHFSVVTEDYQVEQQPSLWSSIRLVK